MDIQTLQIVHFLIAAAIAVFAVFLGSLTIRRRSPKVPPERKVISIEEPVHPVPSVAAIELPESTATALVEPPMNLPTDESANSLFSSSSASAQSAVQSPTVDVPPPSPYMIETRDLRKVFSSKKRGKRSVVEAVKGITFSVDRGEIFGLLGPNGAGKTTTMRMLATLLPATSGTARIDGTELSGGHQQAVRSVIGYVSQVGGMQRESTGRENLLLQAKLYGMSASEATARVNELIKLLDLERFADRKTGTYSGGQRRIFDLASGIVHRPKLLFLDEPSTGLDPQNRVQVWEQVKKMHKEGTTIFVTTHYLEEADALCDRVAIVDQGTIVAIGSPEELKREIASDIVSVELGSTADVGKATELLSTLACITDMSANDRTLNLYVEKGNENLPLIINTLHSHAVESTSIALARPTLDDVFLKLTGHSMKQSPNTTV